MTSTTKTKTRKNKTAPVRRRSLLEEPAAEAPNTLDTTEHKREMTDEEMYEFEMDAAYDLLGSGGVRSVDTNPALGNSPTVYRLEDVHAAWRSATEDHLGNVATIRDAWNSSSDEDCCLNCLCDRFLEQTLEYITIDHRAGLIVLEGI